MKEGLSLGCGAVGNWISDLCGEFEPLCLAALKLACGICSSHCDFNVVAQVCGSAPTSSFPAVYSYPLGKSPRWDSCVEVVIGTVTTASLV